jgi:hypothetical protein
LKIAWGISQYYPNVFYKKKCLAYINNALKKQDIDPNHFAELSDRIARDTWQNKYMGETPPYPIQNPNEDSLKRLSNALEVSQKKTK